MAKARAAAFTPSDAREILSDFRGRRAKGTPYQRGGRKPKPPKARVWLGKTGASGLPARSGSTPGTGDIVLYKLDRAAGSPTAGTIASRKKVNGTDEVTKPCYNPGGLIAGEAYCLVLEDLTGGLWALPISSAFVAKTGGSAIAARSGDTPGSGTVTLYYRNGSTLTSTGETVTAYNMAGEVAASKYIQVKQDAFGDFWIDTEACS